jgi:hypothetical protein
VSTAPGTTRHPLVTGKTHPRMDLVTAAARQRMDLAMAAEAKRGWAPRHYRQPTNQRDTGLDAWNYVSHSLMRTEDTRTPDDLVAF